MGQPTGELAMVRPELLAVDDEPAGRSSIERELRKRYGADYQVICEGSGAAALEHWNRSQRGVGRWRSCWPTCGCPT